MSEKFQYDTTFPDNILVVGQKGCGMSFKCLVQSLGSNNLFGIDLVKVKWISKISSQKVEKIK